MNGIQEYDKIYNDKINNLIDNNCNLIGFCSFISDKSPTTIYNYLCHINNFLKFIEKPIEQIGIDDFTLFFRKSKYTLNGELATQSYRITEYQALKKYGKYLVSKGILHCNPMDMVDRPKFKDSQKTIQKRSRGYLETDEISECINNVLNGCGSDRSISRQREWKERDFAIIMTFLNTGIRCSALYKLDVSSVDVENSNIIVTDKGGDPKIKKVSNATLTAIVNWLDKRKQLLGAHEDIEALFISNQLKRLSNRSIENIVVKYTSTINGKKITPHKLRATFGTQLYNQTKDIHFVQECMDHHSSNTTALYIRGEKNVSDKASSIMDNIVLNNKIKL